MLGMEIGRCSDVYGVDLLGLQDAFTGVGALEKLRGINGRQVLPSQRRIQAFLGFHNPVFEQVRQGAHMRAGVADKAAGNSRTAASAAQQSEPDGGVALCAPHQFRFQNKQIGCGGGAQKIPAGG